MTSAGSGHDDPDPYPSADVMIVAVPPSVDPDATADDLTEIWKKIAHDPLICAIVVTGALSPLPSSTRLPGMQIDSWSPRRSGCGQPLVVAAEHGIAGAAMVLLAEADLSVLADSAFIGVSGDHVGTHWELLAHRVGPQAVLRHALTNVPLPAARAQELGLVQEICPGSEVLSRAIALGRTLGSLRA